MKVAFVMRSMASPAAAGPVATTWAAACVLARAGHEVTLVTEALQRPAEGVRWVPLQPRRDGYWYFTDGQAWADRAADTLIALGHSDRVEFADHPEDALTVLRAKRLLGAFERTEIVIRQAAAGTGGLEGTVAAWAAAYCLEHADRVIAPRAGPLGLTPGPQQPDNGTVVFLDTPGREVAGKRVLVMADERLDALGRPAFPRTHDLPRWDRLDELPGGGAECVVSDPSWRLFALSRGWGDADAFRAYETLEAAAVRAVLEPAKLRRARVRPTHASVSVIIPLYNQGAFVGEAVESARGADVEIVVVDDGSTDPETLRAFRGLDGVRHVEQDNRGLSAARNAGWRAATGELIVPLDADDLLEPGFIDAARHAFDRAPELGWVVGASRYTGLLDLVYAPLGFIAPLTLFLHTHGKAVGMYRRAAVEAVGGYDEHLPAFEDWDLQIALHRAGFETDVLPLVSHVYRRHADSMTFTSSNAQRIPLLQRLLRKHAAELDPATALDMLLLLVELWKSGYEASPSVLLQHGLGDDGVAPGHERRTPGKMPR